VRDRERHPHVVNARKKSGVLSGYSHRARHMLRSLSVDPTSVMTVAEVATYLKVHLKTVYRLVRRKQLPGFRVGGDLGFLRADIDALIMKKEQASQK
jgi:excisionase family DNA binding protein